MNRIMTIALISALLTAGAIQAEASEPTVNNVAASWHPAPTGNGTFQEIDLSFVSVVPRQAITFTIDEQPAGTSYVYGFKQIFEYGTGSLYYDNRIAHTVCVNGVCAQLQPKN